jgi:ribosomal protein L13E
MHIQFNAYPIQCIWEGMKKQEPIIKHSDRAIELVRTGRGYSMAKLDEVGGLRDIRFSRNHGIRVDPLRKTSYRENVQQLGVIAKTIIDSRKPKTKKGGNKKRTDIK